MSANDEETLQELNTKYNNYKSNKSKLQKAINNVNHLVNILEKSIKKVGDSRQNLLSGGLRVDGLAYNNEKFELLIDDINEVIEEVKQVKEKIQERKKYYNEKLMQLEAKIRQKRGF